MDLLEKEFGYWILKPNENIELPKPLEYRFTCTVNKKVELPISEKNVLDYLPEDLKQKYSNIVIGNIILNSIYYKDGTEELCYFRINSTNSLKYPMISGVLKDNNLTIISPENTIKSLSISFIYNYSVKV